jgi:large subunit ribosomal protein L17
MRHRRRSRVLGRSPSHRKALLKNLASALILTERDAEGEENTPKVKGRIITTLHKAKEVRPLVEKCITIARKSLSDLDSASEHATAAKRNTAEWRTWRKGDGWQKWANAMAPAVNARRRLIQLLGDKQAVKILVADIAPRFKDRDGGYTRIVKLAKPRLGDSGKRAILEFVGVRDRKVVKSEKPAFSDEGAGEVSEAAAT